MELRSSKKITPMLMLIIFWLWIAAVGSAFGAISFGLLESGTSNTSISVSPGWGFAVDVVAMDITAESLTQANLDAFTYRIIFPNIEFTLTGNVFANPFDNDQVPTGFNGSIPWYTGAPIPITNDADAGSPGETQFEADLYRTTATQFGIPVSGSFVVLETLTLTAPLVFGDYPVNLNVLEAVDDSGKFHTTEVESGLTISVVPIDSDGDGIPDDQDECPDTVIPESVPTKRLGTNRFALVDGDMTFDTKAPKGKGPRKTFTLEDTAGCSCEQIIEELGLGKGHVKFGCSISAMEEWVDSHSTEICECDLDSDGDCDNQDLAIFEVDWGRIDCGSGGSPSCECDLDSDGDCDSRDLEIFEVDWGRTDCPIFP